MKTIKTLLIVAILVALSGNILAQEKKQKQHKKALNYNIELVFTGEVKNGMDSVFKLMYVFNPVDLKDVAKFRIKRTKGDETIKLKGRKISNKVTGKNGMIYIEVGISDPKKSLPEIEIENDKGEKLKAKFKAKRQDEIEIL